MTTKYRTLTLRNGTVVLAKSEVLALTLNPKQAKEMVKELSKQGIIASIYNARYIKIN